MTSVTRNIEQCHRQTDKLKAILILLECAYLDNHTEDIAYFSKRYAEQLQSMSAPHIRAAMEPELSVSDVWDQAIAAGRKVSLSLHEQITF